ncbi:MAG: helix-turn-helix domain-containing protein [Acidobacteria bacterium ACB2]|nr:helix-turn-helix domain-containing protein [Acidobacteria bacterium ACB2]
MSPAITATHDVFLTPAEVASALGVSPNTVTRWAREGRMPFQMTLGGHRRFEATVVEELRRRLQEQGGTRPAEDAEAPESEPVGASRGR